MPSNDDNTETLLTGVPSEIKSATRLAVTIAGAMYSLIVCGMGAWVIGAYLTDPVLNFLPGKPGAARKNIKYASSMFMLIFCLFVGLHLSVFSFNGIGESLSRFPRFSAKDFLDEIQSLGFLSGVILLLMTGLTWSVIYERRTASVIVFAVLAFACLYDPLLIRFGDERNPLGTLTGWVIYTFSGGLVLLWILSRSALLVMKGLSWSGVYEFPTNAGSEVAVEEQTKVGSEANTEIAKRDPEH